MYPQRIIKEAENIRPWLSRLLTTVIFGGISYFANFRSDTIFDPDSFYHIRHAWLYQQHGIFFSDFPWVQYSVIRLLKADLWYGFHIFLLPFTYFDDLTLGIKISGFFITFFVLWSFYYALKNLGVIWPALWSSFFIFSSPSILKRMAVTRPHPLSLGLSVLIFSLLIEGPWWPVLICGFLVSWLHSALFWFPLIIYGVVFVFKKINRQELGIKKFIALTSGLAAGLLARPHPIANLKLIYIQIVSLYASKKEVLDQIIGGELRPPSLMDVKNSYLFLGIILVGSMFLLVIIFYKKESVPLKQRLAILSSLVLVGISILMYTSANRAIDMLAAFTVILTGLVVSHYLLKIRGNKLNISKRGLSSLLIAIILFMLFVSYNSIIREDLATGKLRTAFEEPALWLKNNTKPGDIVFHTVWSQFPILFYWDQSNYFINGMDPIFLYAYDQGLYWKVFYIHIKDMGGLTCGSITCGPDQIEPVYDVLVKDFHASYVFVRKITNPRFGAYLESDKVHFQKVYDEGSSLIYKVLPPKPQKTTKKADN